MKFAAFSALAAALCSLLALAPLPAQTVLTDDHFVSLGRTPGTSDAVQAFGWDGAGRTYAIGSLRTAGGALVNRVARWDESDWAPVGTFPALPETATPWALAVASDGTLYVAVNRYGTSTATIQRWDGAAWTVFAEATGSISALVLDGAGQLYVAGDFQNLGGTAASRLARWDGVQWEGIPGAPEAIFCLRVGGPNDLLVGGNFLEAGGQAAARVARWDGAQWQGFGTGLNGPVRSLAQGSSGLVYAAGSFSFTQPVVSQGVAVWNGTDWAPLGTGVPSGQSARAISVGPVGDVVLGGSFGEVGGIFVHGLARWNGSQWNALTQGALGLAATPVNSVSVRAIGWDVQGRLCVGGSLVGEEIAASGLARLENGSWRPLGRGVSNLERVAPDGTGGLYAMGRFLHIDGVAACGIAQWRAGRWRALGSGLGGPATGGGLSAPMNAAGLVVQSDGSVVAAGDFGVAGGVATLGVARWDGQAWSAMSTGLGAASVTVLGLASDGVALAGATDFPGSADTARLFRWGGSQWTELRSFTGAPGAIVSISALASSGSRLLVVVRQFLNSTGSSSTRIHQSENGTWTEIGSGFDGVVLGLTADAAGNFYVAGDFGVAGGVAAQRVARWNGSAWSAVGAGFGDFGVGSIQATPDGELIAVGGMNGWHWNGTTWTSLASRVIGARRVVDDGQNGWFVLGNFEVVGGKVSNSLARILRQPGSAAVFTSAVPPAELRVGQPFSHTFTAAGSPAPYFELASGTLPVGLTLSSDGVLSGVPLSGSQMLFPLTVRATNGIGIAATQSFSVRLISRFTDFMGNFGLSGPGTGPEEDFDRDGLNNLLEYALVAHPGQPSPPPLQMGRVTLGANEYLTATFARSRLATDLTLVVEASGGLAGEPWQELARADAGGPMTGLGLLEVWPGGAAEGVMVRDLVPIQTAERRFLRVRVVR